MKQNNFKHLYNFLVKHKDQIHNNFKEQLLVPHDELRYTGHIRNLFEDELFIIGKLYCQKMNIVVQPITSLRYAPAERMNRCGMPLYDYTIIMAKQIGNMTDEEFVFWKLQFC